MPRIERLKTRSRMCRIVILKPKQGTLYAKSSTFPSPLPHPLQQERVVSVVTETKPEKKNSDKKTTSALPSPAVVIVTGSSLPPAKKIGRNVHDLLRNKNQKQPNSGKSGQRQQHSVPDAVRSASVVSSPVRSKLPKNVRFLISDEHHIESDSSDETSSTDSYTDLPSPIPPKTYHNSSKTRTPAASREMNTNPKNHFTQMVEDIDTSGSDTSSNIDAGDMLANVSFSRGEIYFGPQECPIKQFNPKANKMENLYAANAHRDLSSNNLGQATGEASADISPKFTPDQMWDFDSDQESAIDCADFDFCSQAVGSNFNDKGQMQNGARQFNSEFNDWSERLKKSAPQWLSSEDFPEPLVVCRSIGNEASTNEMDPVSVIEKGSDLDLANLDVSNGISQDFSAEYKSQPLDMVNDTVGIHSPRKHNEETAVVPYSYICPSPLDTKDPIQYNSGLEIYWRDV